MSQNQPIFSVGTVTSVPVKQLTPEEYNRLKQKFEEEHKNDPPVRERGICGTMDIYNRHLQQQQQQQQNQQQQNQQLHHMQQQQHM